MIQKTILFFLTMCTVSIMYLGYISRYTHWQRLHSSSFYNVTGHVINSPRTIANFSNSTKVILFWNDLYGKPNWGQSRVPVTPFQQMDCQVTNCVFTDDRSKLEKADAVLFHIVGNMKIRPKMKLMHQRWVFVEHEAPCGRWSELAPYISDFNWTQTFRLDSDLLMLYGSYCKRDQPIQIDFNTILKTKIKPVAWMVSNCQTASNRSEYVRELMKHIPIDVYGRCGYLFNQTNTCERFKHNECLKVIENKYKFYLSFENTLATDYITEKYFEKLGINIVPVVRGDGNYTAVGPPHSFINTNNFSSPKKLAEYLLYLHSHDEEYIKFLKWKEMFKSDGKCSMAESCWCKLCQKLNDPSDPIKYYPDIYEWFGDCRRPEDIIAS